MNNKGQTGAGEAVIILILIIVVGGLVYLLYTKKSDATIYQADSKPRVADFAPATHFGCQYTKIDQYQEGMPSEKNKSVPIDHNINSAQ